MANIDASQVDRGTCEQVTVTMSQRRVCAYILTILYCRYIRYIYAHSTFSHRHRHYFCSQKSRQYTTSERFVYGLLLFLSLTFCSMIRHENTESGVYFAKYPYKFNKLTTPVTLFVLNTNVMVYLTQSTCANWQHLSRHREFSKNSSSHLSYYFRDVQEK